MTGIGGDMFCLFYNSETKKVHALNGSGRAAKNATLESIKKELGLTGKGGQIPMTSVHAVTVPGAAAGWVDSVAKFGSGKVTMSDILAPAIKLAEEGFPVSELSGYYVCCGKYLDAASANPAHSGAQVNKLSAMRRPTFQKC